MLVSVVNDESREFIKPCCSEEKSFNNHPCNLDWKNTCNDVYFIVTPETVINKFIQCFKRAYQINYNMSRAVVAPDKQHLL